MAFPSSSSPSPVAAEVANTSTPSRSRQRSTGLRRLLGWHEVGLRERQQARQLGKAVAVLAQLGLDRLEVHLGVRAVERLQVEHMHEQAAALHVGQELVAEPGAGAGALDQPGDVGDHELAVVPLERAQHRLQGGEG